MVNLEETTALICQDFDLSIPFGEKKYSKEEIRNWLANIISQLMYEDMERFLWILYRLDIAEEKAIDALSFSEAPDLSLADLVIERELQKIKTRREYKKWQERQPKETNGIDIESW